MLVESAGGGCGQCRCGPGFAGPGSLCGPDNDADGWCDAALNCTDPNCVQDNCVGVPNSGQEDADADGVGDACDDDADGDGIIDTADNCPLTPNKNQKDSDKDGFGDACDNCVKVAQNRTERQDTDGDGLGDVCDEDIDGDGIKNNSDNCPFVANADQKDDNYNKIGDACEGDSDYDQDGVPDKQDNCPKTVNADQVDSDNDGEGDACDDDADNDGIINSRDNCPFVANADQADSDADGVGDACSNDCDGDSVLDDEDDCPCNGMISNTNFGTSTTIYMGKNPWRQNQPVWVFHDGGKEIYQGINSAPGVAIGDDKLSSVDYEGTIYVDAKTNDNDWLGAVFSFQDSSNFYVFVSSKAGSGQGQWQLKRVNSKTGVKGSTISAAIRKPVSVKGETTLLWKSKNSAGKF